MMWILAAALLAVAGCGSARYLVLTTDCHYYLTKGKPSLDTKAGMYTIEDRSGQELMIKKDDVKVMERID
jgi:hypothetical protein